MKSFIEHRTSSSFLAYSSNNSQPGCETPDKVQAQVSLGLKGEWAAYDFLMATKKFSYVSQPSTQVFPITPLPSFFSPYKQPDITAISKKTGREVRFHVKTCSNRVVQYRNGDASWIVKDKDPAWNVDPKGCLSFVIFAIERPDGKCDAQYVLTLDKSKSILVPPDEGQDRLPGRKVIYLRNVLRALEEEQQ